MIRLRIDDKHYLEINVRHRDGFYRVNFTQYDEIGNGLVEMCPFADGNFTVKMEGRKSTRKLNALESWLDSYSSILFTEWKQGKQQEIADRIFNFWRTL